MNLVFCADRKMLAGLHVAAQSILAGTAATSDSVAISLFSADLHESDVGLLRKSLDRADRAYSLKLHAIDGKRFDGFPDLQASFATYFRLVVPEVLEVDRFLYIDADTLCRADLSALYQVDLRGHPIGLVPEAPIHHSADPEVAGLLGDLARGDYYNAGVMLVDAVAWRRDDLTRRCLDFIQQHQPRYHDQSALNYVLHGNIYSLPENYNCRTNARENWHALVPPNSGQGRLLHFVDFPKPWSGWGRAVHPLGGLWYAEWRKTACFPSTEGMGDRSFRGVMRNRRKYVQAMKDRLLFSLLSAGWIARVKGMNPP
jgi:lipopolysaccharide biosynthesis glycosyltransferase